MSKTAARGNGAATSRRRTEQTGAYINGKYQARRGIRGFEMAARRGARRSRGTPRTRVARCLPARIRRRCDARLRACAGMLAHKPYAWPGSGLPAAALMYRAIVLPPACIAGIAPCAGDRGIERETAATATRRISRRGVTRSEIARSRANAARQTAAEARLSGEK